MKSYDFINKAHLMSGWLMKGAAEVLLIFQKGL